MLEVSFNIVIKWWNLYNHTTSNKLTKFVMTTLIEAVKQLCLSNQ
ncbi:Uncharacterised protein [Vibrio cholerae]|nr:Uncharacterised protein [Vibrio cholerae]